MPALPSGTILLWSGSIATIPAGFVLCDGNNGTPDLRDRFLYGAGGARAPGYTGGSTQHNHNFIGDGHFHTHAVGSGLQAGIGYIAPSSISSAIGTTQNTNHLPPHYALAFIMKT